MDWLVEKPQNKPVYLETKMTCRNYRFALFFEKNTFLKNHGMQRFHFYQSMIFISPVVIGAVVAAMHNQKFQFFKKSIKNCCAFRMQMRIKCIYTTTSAM